MARLISLLLRLGLLSSTFYASQNTAPQRIMFGSDFPDQIEMGIDAIVAADFLSAEQNADILCNNAARFLHLDLSSCQSQ